MDFIGSANSKGLQSGTTPINVVGPAGGHGRHDFAIDTDEFCKNLVCHLLVVLGRSTCHERGGVRNLK
jgi:hypothetical protein